MHEGHRERLRKSYLAAGGDAMHDHQLLELLLTYAIPRQDTNPLAHRLLKAYGSLEKVLSADVDGSGTVNMSDAQIIVDAILNVR